MVGGALAAAIPDAYKYADGKKIDGKRIVVDVERGRTVKSWKPRRLGTFLQLLVCRLYCWHQQQVLVMFVLGKTFAVVIQEVMWYIHYSDRDASVGFYL